ncbi:pyridoxamine 5'-phosphate oxidase family protein [Haladaptatus sp. F3-133]|jgi:nitroimidazol reductase NimA-like FMN-containing flavoprotein (pyridoxamine 5'-phosphate oxidase superfamily)|uniref:Pyridoxamine 5'-phosphate oxidase family protein n=1 Tax=Halorutilus salinus TaxID=2487751 RepID=A0A9Q4C2P0_9EURY|nr:pyridoxamine 5'-phosphate oxidase family protein [Halorutilus salinus]MCX2818760.1 pyridoxamine 5'-phosphate oxidase family protein [Halorutilus salinus]
MDDTAGDSGSDALLDVMRMSKEERDAFLNDHGTAVLSLARGDEAYSIPVSYGYEADEGLFCIMLGYASDSRKRRWVNDTETATLVVHGMEEDGEADSVVVRGGLVEVDDETACYEAFSNNAEFTVLHESGSFVENTEFVVYRFDVETVEGRKFEHDAPEGIVDEGVGFAPSQD